MHRLPIARTPVARLSQASYESVFGMLEVGGDPGRFSIGPDELHEAALERFFDATLN
mgnify:CR=1 FL=1